MKWNLLIITLLTSLNAGANEKYIGTYLTVSESECNYDLNLLKNGNGAFVFTCRRENGSHIDDKETQEIKWQATGNKIIIQIDGNPEIFIYKPLLSCNSFGQKGSNTGLVGYGTEFWRKPIICK